jgi:crotonobetaine/carnitine-CoA ligase
MSMDLLDFIAKQPENRRTIPWLLTAQAERLGGKQVIRFTHDGSGLTYAGLAAAAEAASARLRDDHQLEAGDIAAIFLPNGSDFITAWFANLFAGLVDIPINYEFKKSTLLYGLSNASAKVIITDGSGFDRLIDPEVRSYLSSLKLLVLAGTFNRDTIVQQLRDHQIRVPVITLAELTAPGPRGAYWQTIDAAELASIRYTSGTTGSAKGIMMTHLQMLNKSNKHMHILTYGKDDTLFSPFPLYHSLASTMGLMSTLQSGGTMVSGLRFSASNYWKDAATNGATLGHILFPLVPMLLAQPESEWDRKHAVRYLWTAWPNEQFERRFNTTFIQIFAQAEIGCVAFQRGGKGDNNRDVGPPMPHMDVQIFDPLDRPVPPGVPGEIVVRPREPHYVMPGYYNNWKATIRAFRNLWLHTGDSGTLDENGHLHFIGRIGDTIRRRGVNISADQIDDEVMKHPGVFECAVIGVPSPLGEEDIQACVVWRDKPADEAAAARELAAFLEARLPKQYVPRFIEICDSLPRTTTGKIQKAMLRGRDRHGAVWDRERNGWVTADSKALQ